jgi:peptide methionine sulfoxide reductase MsrB
MSSQIHDQYIDCCDQEFECDDQLFECHDQYWSQNCWPALVMDWSNHLRDSQKIKFKKISY